MTVAGPFFHLHRAGKVRYATLALVFFCLFVFLWWGKSGGDSKHCVLLERVVEMDSFTESFLGAFKVCVVCCKMPRKTFKLKKMAPI